MSTGIPKAKEEEKTEEDFIRYEVIEETFEEKISRGEEKWIEESLADWKLDSATRAALQNHNSKLQETGFLHAFQDNQSRIWTGLDT